MIDGGPKGGGEVFAASFTENADGVAFERTQWKGRQEIADEFLHPYDHTTEEEELDMGNIRKAVLVVVAMVAGLIATVNETYSSATGCHGGTCIHVNGKGLRVNYATVTNKEGRHTGRGMISSNWDGKTWTGPVLSKGQSWHFDYNRLMSNGNKVCGSIEGLDVACVTIHR
jgi:hypothetical protein